MSNSQTYTLEFRKRIVQDVLAGKSPQAVAAEWGLDAEQVRAWVKEFSTVGRTERPGLLTRSGDLEFKNSDRQLGVIAYAPVSYDLSLGERKRARKKAAGKKKAAPKKAARKKSARKATRKKSARKSAAKKKR